MIEGVRIPNGSRLRFPLVDELAELALVNCFTKIDHDATVAHGAPNVAPAFSR